MIIPTVGRLVHYRTSVNSAVTSDWLQMAEMTPEATESWIDAALSPTQAAGE
jgi:hypothetical protein